MRESGIELPKPDQQEFDTQVFNFDLLRKLYLGEASLIPGFTSNLDAEGLIRAIQEIKSFDSSLYDERRPELKALDYTIPGGITGDERIKQVEIFNHKVDQQRSFIDNIRKQVCEDYFLTHGFKKAFETLKTLTISANDETLEEEEFSLISSFLTDQMSKFVDRDDLRIKPELSKILSEFSQPEKLELLQLLIIDNPSNRGFNFNNLIETITFQEDSPFVNFICRQCLDINKRRKLLRNVRSDYAGIIAYQGSYDGRARNKTSDDSWKLIDSIRPDKTQKTDSSLIMIAADTVAMVNRQGKPEYYTHFDTKDARNKSEQSYYQDIISNLYLFTPEDIYGDYETEYLRNHDGFTIYEKIEDSTDIINLISNLNKIVSKYFEIKLNDWERLGDAWSRLCPFFSGEEWQNFLEESSKFEGFDNYDLFNNEKYDNLVKTLSNFSNFAGEFTNNIREWLEKIKPEVESMIPLYHFESYDRLPEDLEVNPFGLEDNELPIYFQYLHNPIFQMKLEEELGIILPEMKLSSQIQLIKFLVATDQETYQRFQTIFGVKIDVSDGRFAHFYDRVQDVSDGRFAPFYDRVQNDKFGENIKFRQDFLNSFLSCAEDAEFGRKLMDLLENSDLNSPILTVDNIEVFGREIEIKKSCAELIFGKYAEIVDAVENVRSYLMENYHGQTDNQTIQLITQNLLRKGKDLLSDFADNPREPKEVIEALSNYQAENLLFISVLKSKKERGELLQLVEFTKFRPEIHDEENPIDPEEQAKILEIVRQNWSAHPAFTETVVRNVRETMNSLKGREFIIFKYGDQINGCMRFDETDDPDTLHWASVNVAPNLRGSGLGKALVRDFLLIKAEGKIIEAETLPSDEIASTYINDFGFVAKRVVQFGDTGEYVFEIELNGKRGQEASSPSISEDSIVLEYDLNAQYDQMIGDTEHYLNDLGYVITSFPRQKDGRCRIILEKRQEAIEPEKELINA